MNGEVNGTMEKPMDTSVPNSPDSLQNQKEVSPEECDNATNDCENSNNTEDSNHLDSENGKECLAESNEELVEDDNSKASETHESEALEPEAPPKVTENETSNTSFTENHCANSNESYAESTSSQAKSEATDQLNSLNDVDEKSKDEQSEHLFGKNITTNENTENEMDSEEDSSEEEAFGVQPNVGDTVSINLDSEQEGEDDSHESEMKNKSNDVIILENDRSPSQNGTNHNSPSPEVHEIISDNEECITPDEKPKAKDVDNKVQLRRSSRAIKRKRYTDDMENGNDQMDIEEVLDGSFKRKSRPIVINDTKTLVEMAAKPMRGYNSNNQRKEPTVVIIDTHSSTSEKSPASFKNAGITSNASLNAQNLYKSIIARGTTVTAVKTTSAPSASEAKQNASQSPQTSILPSLTDDMFVVEAPSFIVPYVYEKPSVKPFREFVDILGKELDEQKAKEEKELEEKLKKDKERKEKEKEESKEKGGEGEESDDEASSSPKQSGSAEATPSSADGAHTSAEPAAEGEEKKKKKKGWSKRHPDDDDDASWHGDTSSDSEDEILSDEDKTIIIKDKADDAIQEIKDVTHLTAEKVCTTKSDNYFDCSLGKFFINIGLSLVQEYVQSDLLKQQNRKLYREKKTGQNTKNTETSIASLMKNIEFSKENNAPYLFPQQKCEFCSFKAESRLVMAHHLETPHMKNNVYKCNFCSFEIRSPHDILYHMEAEHSTRGKLERAPAYHQCANCPFEDNGKGKLARHLIPCAKKFKPDFNLAPPLEWEPPAKIPKITRARNNMVGSYQNAFKNQLGNNLVRPLNVAPMMPGVSAYRARGRSPMGVPPRAPAVHGTPIMRGGVMVRHNAPGHMSSNYPVPNNVKKPGHQPSISITPLPRQPQPQPQPQPAHNAKSTFVICEICDGYIKDLEQLRNHMQWIHKVKIHPKMIYNRPPLNCQKCQFRFFTDQGLERHLLGSHGLVTSSMQEAANKGKDAGRCPVCGRVYQWKLLNHVARDHNLTLKPAHLSYKCTVCTATFGMYKQFENHVYSAHSVVAKRVMDKSKPAPKPNNDSLLKPLKINDEITIIPQPVKAPAKDE